MPPTIGIGSAGVLNGAPAGARRVGSALCRRIRAPMEARGEGRRWSPAAPAASAPRPPRGSPPRAPRSGSATSTSPAPSEVAGEVAGHAIELDVTEPRRPRRAAVEAAATLDILVNNAGTDEFGFFTQTTPEQWQRVIAINLVGVLNCTYAALAGMQQAQYGRIVSISSEAGRVGSKGSAVYSAAKGGVIAFMKTIARENARYGVTANSIAPGPIETPLLMGAKALGEVGEKLIGDMNR